jgi:hypothetical protein
MGIAGGRIWLTSSHALLPRPPVIEHENPLAAELRSGPPRHGWQLVYIVVRRASSASSCRAAQRAILSSGWAVMSRSVTTVLRASASTSPPGPTSSDPNGISPAARAAASSMALPGGVRPHPSSVSSVDRVHCSQTVERAQTVSGPSATTRPAPADRDPLAAHQHLDPARELDRLLAGDDAEAPGIGVTP